MHQGTALSPAVHAEDRSREAPDTKQEHPPLPATLPALAQLETCTAENVKSLKRLTQLLLPIQYPDRFWKETVESPVISSLTRLVRWKQQGIEGPIVAGIRCKIVDEQLYISTLCTLSAFREHGLGTHLLQAVTLSAVRDYGVSAITAHVWEANEDALEWYRKRGFRVISREHGYYRKLAPKTTALFIRKDLNAE